MSENEDKLLSKLLADEPFRKWVAAGEFRKSGNYWSDWLAGHPEFSQTVWQAIDIVLASHWDEPVGDDEVEQVLTGAEKKIEGYRQHQRVRKIWWRMAAASVLLAGALTWWGNSTGEANGSSEASVSLTTPEGWMEFRNTGSVNRSRVLPDGSSIVLLPGSRVLYHSAFGDSTRTVKLSGTAFFEVAKKEGIPFYVQAPDVTMRVTGTSFGVRTPGRSKDLEVAVHSGSVAVYPGKAGPVTLTAGRQAVYTPESGELKAADPFDWMTKILEIFQTEFEDERASDILTNLGKAYGMEVQFDEDRFSECVLTTSLYDLPLPNKLALIATSLGGDTRYEITDDNRIIFNGSGCKPDNQ